MDKKILEYVYDMVGDESEQVYSAVFEIIDMVQQKYLFKSVQLNEINIATSSGESIVIMFDEVPYVFQYYLSQEEYNKVNTFIDGINTRKITKEINIWGGFGRRRKITESFTLKYDISPFITDKLMTFPEINTVVWNKVIPINTYVGIEYGKQDPSFVKNNKYKILWDLSKSLEGIHQNMFAHGDSSLDNAGIQGKTLAFYDYGTSIDARTIEDLEYILKIMKADEGRLLRSINNYLPKEKRISIPGEDLLVYIIKRVKIEQGFDTHSSALDYLENLEIVL